MALIPKKFKYKKYLKGKLYGNKLRNNLITGDISLKANELGRLTPKQIETTKRLIRKIIKPKGGIVKTKITAHIPVTAKPLAVRMGRGKGKISIYTAPVKKGTILFEIFCLDKTTAYNALKKAGYKLPIQTKIILNFKLS
jgi:large subunit ribosomal protein L16